VSVLPLVFLAVVTALAASATAREDAPRIVALGDSLTSGRGIGKADAYPAVLQRRLEDGGYTYSVAFHRAYEELAARYRIPLVPFVLMNVMTDASLMQSDRAHPNQAGARAIADLIWPLLQPLLKKAE